MMVTFISQCEKKAHKTTRRVLDAFANRIGDNTWQTVITQEGLNAAKKLLRKTATKNTAVSCHWIRSRGRSEFVWAVGNKNKFNDQGIVPVNYTEKNMLNSTFENDWKFLPLIKALATLAGLFHDWGKSSKLFQEKLTPKSKFKFQGDPIRHEWITCLLLNALIQTSDSKSDENWLKKLADGEINEEMITSIARDQNPKPLNNLPFVGKLVLWLIVSHHRLPLTFDDWRGENGNDLDVMLKRITQKWGYENRYDEVEFNKRLKNCFIFANGLMTQSNKWLKAIKKQASRLLDYLDLFQEVSSNGSYRLILHHARLCLMLGDHFYSSQIESDKKWQDITGLYANSDKNGYKQKLDEHLFHVAKTAQSIAHLLPMFESEPPQTDDNRELKKSSPPMYRWQDKAVEKINRWKHQNRNQNTGFFAVNMASTGCGKTFANAKVMRSLSADGKSMRYILALGLRTLTLQTGDEYREKIKLDNSELAVLIGSKAVLDLHQQITIDEQSQQNQFSGAESFEPLLDEEIDFECEIPEDKLSTVLKSEKDRKFLYAPVLACTIDHIMGATETTRGGRYILPSLRLMSSDLVIDEIDDFTGSDLIAIGRLIHLAGMLGRKVMISSATIPPDLAEGYFNAYKNGWNVFCNSRENVKSEIGCAWIDEFNTSTFSITLSDDSFENNVYNKFHSGFIEKRVEKLQQHQARRKAEIINCQSEMESCEFDLDETKQETYFSLIKEAVTHNHENHHIVDEKSGIKVSFGVIRVANINPCISLTRYLLCSDFPNDISLKTMAYHSRQVLLLRHEQEKHLDVVLKRKERPGEQPKAFSNSIIREALDTCITNNLIFILVATPVEEVGRDHDFDWAIVEPSSYRSIIQLAGRVRRHRFDPIDNANISLMEYSWKAFNNGDKQGKHYFNYPGYETGEDGRVLNTHSLSQLLNENAISKCLDAVPRIKKPDILDCQNSLADLEHYSIQEDINNTSTEGPETLQGYLSEHWYLTALPQKLNRFRKSQRSVNLFLTYDDGRDLFYFAEKDENGYPVDREEIHRITHVDFKAEELNRLWLVRDYKNSVIEESLNRETTPRNISLRFGEVSITYYENSNSEYEYNDQFGLVKSE